MSRRPALVTLAAAATLAVASLAAPAPALAGGFDVGLDAGWQGLNNASSSAKAVFDGSTGGFAFGAQARYGLGQRFFVGAGFRTMSKTGERVFVADPSGPVFPLGHPLDLRVTPVFATFGYRFSAGSAFTPYLGVGGGFTMIHEESTVGGVTDTEDQTKASGLAFAGLEFGKGSLRLAAEVSYSTVPNSLGVGGVSAVYGETNIGGLGAMARVIWAP